MSLLLCIWTLFPHSDRLLWTRPSSLSLAEQGDSETGEAPSAPGMPPV